MNKNNNPLNVKNNPARPWKGSTSTDMRGHAVFADPEMGIRAAFYSLEKKWRNGKKTLSEIISDWAPSDDTQGSIPGNPVNDPSAYTYFVADVAGIKNLEPLPNPRTSPCVWAAIIRAMSKYEMGEYCPWAVILRGISNWFIDFVEE